MLSELKVTLKVKRKRWFILLQKITLFLGSLGLLPLDKAISVINRALSYGAFKYKINNGNWMVLKTNNRIVLKE